jgi:hypothetical protein
MILYDLCLSPAQFCYIIVYIRKVESCVQAVDWCAPRKISNGAQTLVLLASFVIAAVPRYIASERIAQKTTLPIVHVAIAPAA